MKQPWQMTRREFYSPVGHLPKNWNEQGWVLTGELAISKIGNRYINRNGKLYRPFNEDYHEYLIKRALQQGKHISKKVLSDYPEVLQESLHEHRHIHLYCGKTFRTLEEAKAHSAEKSCQPSAATLRAMAAKRKVLQGKTSGYSRGEI